MEAFAGENVRYGRVMGRRTINKEEIRDGRYRAAACSEFSELSVFLFLKLAASIFSKPRLVGSLIIFCSAASFSLRGCRVPSKVFFTAKHLTVFVFSELLFQSVKKKKEEKGKKESAKATLPFLLVS